ncbi:hypothetical protein R3P38DRAFT_2778626 [Favolaschia claudopus]|uniref:Uncharacterized protein n=1 Tax=Favolaschia claudopus TaxID=2862362 RepID=A0AAW0BHV3_9AGAR
MLQRGRKSGMLITAAHSGACREENNGHCSTAAYWQSNTALETNAGPGKSGLGHTPRSRPQGMAKIDNPPPDETMHEHINGMVEFRGIAVRKEMARHNNAASEDSQKVWRPGCRNSEHCSTAADRQSNTLILHLEIPEYRPQRLARSMRTG